MAGWLKTYPPVAADLSASDVIKALWSRRPENECLAEVGAALGVKHPVPVNSGRAALYLLLKTMLPEGSPVILPGYTCYTVLAAVIKAGMVPVLADLDPANLGYNLDNLRQTLVDYPETKAVIVCHLFGIPVDIDAVRNVTGPGIAVIDDAAQGFGIKSGDRYLGCGGDAGFYSFGRGKNLALGGGGLIVTDDDTIAAGLRALIKSDHRTAKMSPGDLLKAAAYNLAVRPAVFGMLSRLPGMRLGQSVFRPDFAVFRHSPFRATCANKRPTFTFPWPCRATGAGRASDGRLVSTQRR